MQISKMDDLFDFGIIGKQCFIGFTQKPDLASIEEARQLLNQIADDLIKLTLENHHA